MVNPVLQNYGSGDKGIQSASFTPVQSKLSYSAPGKIGSTKSFPSSTINTLETAPQADIEDEAIPAATYQPGGELSEDDDSASSEDFEKSVHQMLDKGKNISSNTRTEMWNMVLDQSVVPATKSPFPDTLQNDKSAVEGGKVEGENLDLSKLINPCEMMRNQREDRRWSQRIQQKPQEGASPGSIKLKEKAKKRSLSGNNTLNSNSFSILADDDLVERIVNLGVPPPDSTYDTVDLLKDLELTRILLNKKNQEDVEKPVSENPQQIDDSEIIILNSDTLEWKDDESIASDDFVTVTPKRNRRPPKRLSISIAPKKKKKKGSNKEKPCQNPQSANPNKGDSGSSKPSSFLHNSTIIK